MIYDMFVLVLGTDAMDVSGENQIAVDHNLFKQRLSLTYYLPYVCFSFEHRCYGCVRRESD